MQQTDFSTDIGARRGTRTLTPRTVQPVEIIKNRCENDDFWRFSISILVNPFQPVSTGPDLIVFYTESQGGAS
jgi:hypothetical protein